MKRPRSILFLILRAVGVAALCALLVFCLLRLEEGGPVEEAQLRFVGTGDDADCTVLKSRDSCVMIDTGEAADAPAILRALEEMGVERIDCMILTHPDKDHIGGASAILEALPVKQVVCPYYAAENERYAALTKELEERGIGVLIPARDRTLTLGDLQVRIFPPEKTYYEKDNDYSLAVLIRHGEVRMFFAGDAQKERLKEFEEYDIGQVDLYKVACHGRSSKPGAEWIHRLHPVYAVITASEAGANIRQALEEVGTQVFYTRGQEAIFFSDGERLFPKKGKEG